MAACGAETKKCKDCGHHQRDHDFAPPEDTRRGRCKKCRLMEQPDRCPTGFVGIPCEAEGNGAGGRCTQFHGGKSLGGVLHPNAHSPWSAKLPKGVRHDYERAMADEQLLSLRHEIGVARAYAMDLAKQAASYAWGRPTASRKLRRLSDAWDAYLGAEGATTRQSARNVVSERLGELHEAVTAALGERQALGELREQVAVLERLVRSENMRMVEIYNMISSERAMALRQAETTACLESIDELVPDRELRHAIRRRVASKLAAITGRGNHPALDTGGGPDGKPGDPEAA